MKSDRLAAIAHMVPTFPTYPPEASYMQDGEHVSQYPALLAGETGYGGRVVYFAADYDRRYGDIFFPDFGDLLKNAILWALGTQNVDFTVQGRGELECKLFAQNNDTRWILHIINHSGTGKWPGSVEEIYPVGPEKVTVKVGNRKIEEVRARSTDRAIAFAQDHGVVSFTLEEIADQELVIIQ